MDASRQCELTILATIGAGGRVGVSESSLRHLISSSWGAIALLQLDSLLKAVFGKEYVITEGDCFVLTKIGWQHLAELITERIADLDRADNASTASLFDPNLPPLESDLVVRGGPRTVDPSDPHGRDPKPVQAPDLRFLHMGGGNF